MRTEQLTKCFVPLQKLMATLAPYFITDRSKAVIRLWFYVSCFGGRVSVMFHLMCVHIILVRFGLLSGHLFGKSCSLG